MTQDGWMQVLRPTGLPGLLLISLLIAAASAPCLAADQETRDFSVKIDRKPAGSYRMTIARRDDGSQVMSGRASVKLSYLIYTYRYSYQGTEVWKNGQLAQLQSTSNDDGKRSSVTAVSSGAVLQVRANGSPKTVPADAWTTTYWRLPEARLRNHAITLLDADTGKELHGTLQFVGTQQLAAAGQTQNCSHYRLSGDLQVELWYDAQERLVRQEAVEDGHRTLLELLQIIR